MWPVAVLHVAVESLMHVSAMWVDDRRITFVVGSGLTLLILTLWLGVLLRECGEKKPRDCEEPNPPLYASAFAKLRVYAAPFR